jgi:ABC-type transport system involved in multi-copper enzyme maturation permease subunit
MTVARTKTTKTLHESAYESVYKSVGESAGPKARDGFGQALRAEWIKLRSARGMVIAVIAAIGLTVLVSLAGASAASTDSNGGPSYLDRFRFAHRPLSGDGSVTARVAAQQASHEWAKAGVIIKQSVDPGAPYAAIMVTPGHGVRMQGNFDTELTGSARAAPRWLKLTRAGTSVTGYESADGIRWNTVGTVDLGALPRTVQAGVFVASPSNYRVVRQPGGSSSVVWFPTVGKATFADLALETAASPGPAGPARPARWTEEDLGSPGDQRAAPVPSAPSAAPRTVSGDTFTVTGSGDVGGWDVGGIELPGANDIVMDALFGVQIGMMAIIALGVLFVTSEYKTGLIRTTFAASPRRGRVLAAKAIVLAGAVFVTGLIASVAALYLSRPIQRGNGYVPPAYPDPSLADEPVLRAVVGTALFLAVLAVFSLAVATVLRRAAAAVTLVIGLVVVVPVVVSVLSVDATTWIQRTTPIAGLAIQQTKHRFDTAIGPWAGLGVLCAWAAVALGLAFWQLRRRDA